MLDLTTQFGRADSKKILEIGFGMGKPTAKIAQALPECDFLAAGVHTPGVGALLKLIDELTLTNIRVIQHDVVEVLQNMLMAVWMECIFSSLIPGIKNATINAA